MNKRFRGNEYSRRRVALIGECLNELNGAASGNLRLAYGGDTLNTALYLARLISSSGTRRRNSLRLEKSYGIWSREFSRDYSPHMAGLGRFIDYQKPAFIGRHEALKDRDTPPARRLVTLAIAADDADATGYEPIYRANELVGFVTSGGYGHCVQKSLAMGYLDSTVQTESDELTVTILGEPRPARLVPQALVDPTGHRMRS